MRASTAIYLVYPCISLPTCLVTQAGYVFTFADRMPQLDTELPRGIFHGGSFSSVSVV